MSALTRLSRQLLRSSIPPETAEHIERRAAEERARDERERAERDAEWLRALASSSLRGEFGAEVKAAAEAYLIQGGVLRDDLPNLREWAKRARKMRARRR